MLAKGKNNVRGVKNKVPAQSIHMIVKVVTGQQLKENANYNGVVSGLDASVSTAEVKGLMGSSG